MPSRSTCVADKWRLTLLKPSKRGRISSGWWRRGYWCGLFAPPHRTPSAVPFYGAQSRRRSPMGLTVHCCHEHQPPRLPIPPPAPCIRAAQVRLKDRNPVPLDNLELLLHGTYEQLMELAHAAEGANQQLAFHGVRLSAATRLLLLLIRIRFGLTPEEAAMIEAHLSPEVIEVQDQGWEELTYASLTYLLRYMLAKPGKHESMPTSSMQTLTRPTDTSKLKKHVTLMCDRLNKGLRPREPEEEK
mmetsp:Transcript_15514/g.43432  ORF Transcript_15514/g.43432 Transcript_15514/m.43432 type:complete len:244 (+) Transcript_15514:1917-2648(+)